MALTKNQRARLKGKYGGKCAYCGCDLPDKGWHADHIEPVHRESKIVRCSEEEWARTGLSHKTVATGEMAMPHNDRPENYNPACAPCNLFKHSFSLEFFREEIGRQIERARKSSVNFRTAERFGLIEETGNPIVFWFEEYEARNAEV